MDKEQFQQLVTRYLAGQASEAEKAFLEAYYAAFDARPDVISELTAAEQSRLEEILYAGLKQQMPAAAPVRRMRFQRWWAYAAASVVVLLLAGTYLWQHNTPPEATPDITQQLPADIPPGKTGAILTLADGTRVKLDSLGNGVVATQNGTPVVLNNGQLRYTSPGKNITGITYNTMTTPKGRQFQVRLPDGTSVWLNAASSIRYPTAFTGKERKVEITGEAYFEVAANSKMPFKIKAANKAEIDVLGTHFNVNSYADEKSLNATLLEGAIRLTTLSGNETAVLRPGQQAQLAERLQVIKTVDTEKVIAWKNGYFNFEGKSLEEVLRQLTRWYDLTIVAEGKFPDIRFGGEMEMGLPLSDVLIFLEKSDVHFRIEAGHKLIVLP
jgi:transmembrane sensor